MKREFLIFAMIIGILEILVFRDFIFGEYYFIFKDLGSDSYVNDYPLLYNRLSEMNYGFLPGWSFHNGLGENLYPFSFDPFCWLLYKILLLSPEQIMLIIPLIYIYFSGIMMYLFLYELGLHFTARIFGGLVFAFSSYYLLSCTWSVTLFSPCGFHFAFLLFALQRAVAKKQYLWLAFVYALVGISYPFNIFFSLIFSAAYFLASFYISKKKTRVFFKQILFSAISIGAGIGMSCWMLFSSLQLMMQSPRASGKVQAYEFKPGLFASKGELLSALYRLFSPNLLGDVNHFSIYRNYFEAPLLYCGTVTLLLLSQIAVLSKRARLISIISISALVCIYISPALRSWVWLNTGDYYRILNIFFILILCIISSTIFSRIITTGKIRIRPLLITSGIFIIILLIGFNHLKTEWSSSFLVPVVFIFLYTSIFIFQKMNFKFKLWSGILLLILGFESMINSSQTIQRREVCTDADIRHAGYMDKSAKEITKINNHDTSFFRLEKDFYSGVSWLASYNEAKVQDYHSSQAYNSFNNSNYIEFLKTFEQIKKNDEPDTRFVTGIKSSFLLMKLCSVKYFFSSHPENQNSIPSYFSEIKDNGNFRILKDENPLPFGFCYDRILSLKRFNTYPKSEKERTALRSIVVNDEIFNKLKNHEAEEEKHENLSLEDQIHERKQDTLTINTFRDNFISGRINVPATRFLFLSMPYDEGWKATDNEKPIDINKAFGGLCFVTLEKGRHTIELSYTPPFISLGIWISVLSLFIFLLLVFFQLKASHDNE